MGVSRSFFLSNGKIIGNNIVVDPSRIYACIAFVPLFRGTSKEFAEGVSRGHFGWLNPLTKVF